MKLKYVVLLSIAIIILMLIATFMFSARIFFVVLMLDLMCIQIGLTRMDMILARVEQSGLAPDRGSTVIVEEIK